MSTVSMWTGLAPTDRDLVRGARVGSRADCETLVRRYQKPLHVVCYHYVRDHDVAADVAQRAIIRAIGSLADLRDPDFFRGWLFRIGVNLALNHLRDDARFVNRSQPHADGGPGVHALVEAVEQSRVLQRAVSLLPARQRQIVELRVYQELPFRQIAVALATTANAAKVSYHHAVKRLRRLMVVEPV
jgi:RNA polymerase sigma-70 factor (ECF subfamily)